MILVLQVNRDAPGVSISTLASLLGRRSLAFAQIALGCMHIVILENHVDW